MHFVVGLGDNRINNVSILFKGETTVTFILFEIFSFFTQVKKNVGLSEQFIMLLQVDLFISLALSTYICISQLTGS